MSEDVRFRELIRRYTADPDWLPSVSRDITDAIHVQLPGLDEEDLRPATYASSESVLRLLAYMIRNDVTPREAEPPPAAADYTREFVRRGVPLDSLLRAYHIGHAMFFHRWAEAVRADPLTDGEEAYAIEWGADWTFEFVEALSAGLVRLYADERERWVRSAAAIRAQTVEAILRDELADLQTASARLRYDLDRTRSRAGRRGPTVGRGTRSQSSIWTRTDSLACWPLAARPSRVSKASAAATMRRSTPAVSRSSHAGGREP